MLLNHDFFPAVKECTIPKFGTIYSATNDSISKNVIALKKFNAIPTSISDIDTAQIKIAREGEYDYTDSFFQYGSMVREGVLFVPKKFSDRSKIILLRRSILLYKNNMLIPKQSRIENFNLEQFLEHMEEDKDYHILKEYMPFYTKRLDEYAAMNFLHQKNVKDYGLFLHDQDAKSTNIFHMYDKSHINSLDYAFADQIWYNPSYEHNSSIILNGSKYGSSRRLRGIKYDKPIVSSNIVNLSDIEQKLNLETAQKFSNN